MQEPVIILGDSPFLNEIEDKLQYILTRYYSIGINRVITKFKTNAHIFTDMGIIPLTNKYEEIKTISLNIYGDLIRKPKLNKELIDTFSFDLEKDTEFYKDNKLAWCGFTHDFAISYCLYKGIRDIILIGASDFMSNKHYSCKEPFNFSNKLKENSISYIENICMKHANIATCNPESLLNIPRVNIDELLK